MTAAWLAAGEQGAGGSALGRVALVAVAVLAVGAFAILQVRARSQRRGRRPVDWRYGYQPGYEPYPLYDPDRSPWAVRDEGRS